MSTQSKTIPDWLLEAAEKEVRRVETDWWTSKEAEDYHPLIARAVIDLCIQEGFDPWKAAERHEGKY